MRGKTSVTSIYKHQHQHQKLRAEFESTFHNRYAALATLQEDSETDTYSALAQAALETGESILPPTPRQNRRIPWNDADIQAHREKKRLARNKSDKQKLSHQLSDLYAGKVTKYIDEQCKIVETAHPAAEYRVDWKAVRKISGNRKPNDLAIVTEDVQHAQELLRALEDAAAEVGLIINCKKTKVLACDKIPPFSITLRDYSPIEHVSDFKYLGSWI
ncbi:hypothetical protein P5673_020178 [Acropora cervicornis]|uniref:Reverse transcriptase n=1 Tax=Acropora cervicornis TaxID=6130 RepID=A0AAD9V182_ACRCE|nr:hypothetical protein P5673_020178 [Acropora cervicornis]